MTLARRIDKLLFRLTPPPPRPSAGEEWILVFGDSLCAGRAPAYLGRMLKAVGLQVGVGVVAGSGKTACELAESLAGFRPPAGQTPPAMAIILVGGNHAKRGHSPTVEDMTKALARCVDSVSSRWPGCAQVLCTVPVPGQHPALRDDAPALVTSVINPAIRRVARARSATLCELETVFHGAPAACTDGVHPSASGDQRLADRWFQAVWPFCARTPPRDR